MDQETLRQHAASLKAIAQDLDQWAGLAAQHPPASAPPPANRSGFVPEPPTDVAVPPADASEELPQVHLELTTSGALGSARIGMLLRLHPVVMDRLTAALADVRSRDRTGWYTTALLRQVERLERTPVGTRPAFLRYTDPRPHVARTIHVPTEVHLRLSACAQRLGLTLQALGCSALERELERHRAPSEDVPF